MAIVRTKPTPINTVILFTAAAAAHRINDGDYVKPGSGRFTVVDDREVWTPDPRTPNRELVGQVIAGTIEATDEDAIMASNMITHYKGLTFQLLAGKLLSEFDQKALQIASAEESTTADVPVVTALPSCYARAVARKSVEDRLADCEGRYVAALGSKVVVQGEVVRCVYSQQWATYYVTVITEDNLAVFFGFKRSLQVGSKIKVAGTVKAQRPGFQTQLNYVKTV